MKTTPIKSLIFLSLLLTFTVALRPPSAKNRLLLGGTLQGGVNLLVDPLQNGMPILGNPLQIEVNGLVNP